MTAFINDKSNIMGLGFVAALWCALAGCTGPLSYRPKVATKPVAAVVSVKKSDLPPKPDEKANNATLAGIDTLGVGVRDDVHISIFTNYTSSKKRTPLMALGKTLQGILVKTPKTPDEAKKLEQSFDNALLTLKRVTGLKPSEADEMNYFLFRQSFNTPARLNAYLQYKFLLGG
jgi:hypothetical protein